jgi:hypothetical protein
MPSPFPGMDPYFENPAIWADFHDSLIYCIRAALQPQIKPKYVALTQDRLYVLESEHPIFPDVALIRSSSPQSTTATVATLEPDAPTVFELWREDIREPVIHIVEPAANNRIITSIEVISPTNKAAGEGRVAYLQKQDELWRGGANLVEIDLLRAGPLLIRLSEEKLKSLKPWHYLTAVTRRWPSRLEIYEITLHKPLPKIAIPLTPDDKDVVLDLQAVFNANWEHGPYPEILRYDEAPPGPLTPDEIAWCEERLRAAGFRASKPS